MFEHHSMGLLPWSAFRARLAAAAALGLGLILASLAGGMLGYRYIAGQTWPDSFLNAAMILSGMGPVGELKSTGAKIFAGLYALYSGLTLISVVGLVLAPVIHRFLHKFHLEPEKAAKGE
ncbi:MAG: hypothetical protein LC796_15150 [Acidobacteria bacterium]|nr:hypothetical protein [Acidobacteriota bacterium]MCA1612075.1 hypothetical protein [Acidobacteriota bacterium]